MSQNNLEGWNVDSNCNPEVASALINTYPMIESLHSQFEKDTIHLSVSSLKHFYDEKGCPIQERLSNTNSFWTRQRPFPFNSIDRDSVVLEIWEKKEESFKHIVLFQEKEEILKILERKNKFPERTTAVLCSFNRENKEHCGLYIIETQKKVKKEKVLKNMFITDNIKMLLDPRKL